jgi:CRISPR system Cascade subunit CasB
MTHAETIQNSGESQVYGRVPDALSSAIYNIAWAMRQQIISPGDLASLRRLEPDEPGDAAFWKILASTIEPAGLLPHSGPLRDAVERQWAVLLNALAIAGGQHATDVRLGGALAEAELSELRFVRLVRARGPALENEIRAIGRILASKALQANWVEVVQLLRHQDDEHCERWRRKIARDYYLAKHHAKH